MMSLLFYNVVGYRIGGFFMVIREGTNVIIGNEVESINAVISSVIIDEQNDFVDLELTLENGDNKLYAFESFGKKLFLTKNDMKNEINYKQICHAQHINLQYFYFSKRSSLLNMFLNIS